MAKANIGEVSWSPNEKRWIIKVYYNNGGAVSPAEVFNGPVLANHLRRAGVPSPLAGTNSGNYSCVVWSKDNPDDLNRHGATLLNVLKKHYAKFQGVKVNWSLK